MKGTLSARRIVTVFAFFGLCSPSLAAQLPKLSDAEILKLPRRERVVVLNFWATWCTPCAKEIPALNRLQAEHPEAHFTGVNMDYVENEGAIHGFLGKHPIAYRVVLRRGNSFRKLSAAIDPAWKQGLPATFVFRNGKRVFSKIGMIDEAELERALQAAALDAAEQ